MPSGLKGTVIWGLRSRSSSSTAISSASSWGDFEVPRKPKGTVTVEKYRGRLRLRLPRHVFGGVQKYMSLGLANTAENRRIAKAKAQQIEADIALENFDHSLKRYRSKYAVANDEPPLIDLWEKFTQFKRNTIESTTIDTTYKTVETHIKALPTQQIAQAKLIRKHLRDKLSPRAAKKAFNYIKACCAWAYDEELISANPFQFLRIQAKSSAPEIDPFTIDERDQIIKAFEENEYYSYYTDFVKFCFWTGCRQSEAIGLRWDDLSPDLSVITISEAYVLKRRKDTKTHKTRRFPVNEQLRQLLGPIKTAQRGKGIIFRSKTGKYIDSHNFLNRAWKGVLGTLPHIRYRKAYNTRHTFITLCLNEGISLTQVAAWCGNSPKTILNSYAGIVTTVGVPEF
ncbi:MAG: tyrosine-type recombinase/integrase [Spirulina sp. SIO3F2]|nr:tyrosine-type recombinase/integrase [Spirulina sp. SIO3F2]